MKGVLIIGLLFTCINSFSQNQESPQLSASVKIKWVNNLAGDFSFKNKWSYPEGVYRNKYGQLSCDGTCPPGIDAMIGSKGKIYKDSLRSFYKIVDTSHLRHSISCEAWCYEWAGTDFIDVFSKTNDTISCITLCNVSTHSSLQLDIVNDYCTATISLNSIVSGGSRKFYCTEGYITIDKRLWEKGIMKADFNFNFFDNNLDSSKPMYWKGKIYWDIRSAPGTYNK